MFSFADADSSHYIALQSPGTIASSFTLTLPATDAAVSGYVLASDASGTLSWVDPGSSSSPTFTGDATLTNDGALVGFSNLNATYTGNSKTLTVTVATKTAAHRYNGTGSSSGYKIGGKEAPFLTLTPGRTYVFDQADNSNSGHPLRFYLEADKTTAYTTGVTTNGTAGSAGAYTQIVVSDTTPQILHYQCSSHASMGNSVNTSGVPTQASNATALLGSRTIGGVVFDNTGDINLPGVNAAGNQDTSGTAAVATAITIADESSDTTCFPLFATAATGNLGAKSGSNLTFNSSSGALTATSFVGAFTGNATTATKANSVQVDATSDTNCFPMLTASGATGQKAVKSSSNLSFNSSSGALTATSFVGDLTGDVTGNVSGSAATVTGAAQSAITSVGTLTGLTVSGAVALENDVSIVDTIYHSGDSHTKIRFPSGDTFTVETGGVEAFRVDSGQRVLIGTTTEGEASADNLTIADSANCGITIRSGSSNAGGIYFSDGTSGADEYKGLIAYNHSSDHLELFTSGSERMRITSDGKLLLGQNNDNDGQLCMAGVLAFSAGGSGTASTSNARPNISRGADGQLILAGGKDSGSSIRFDVAANGSTNAGEVGRFDASGRLLIGTTTEGHVSADDLTIAGSSDSGITVRSGTSNSGRIFFSDGTSGADEYKGAIEYSHANNSFVFNTNATTALTISSSQNATFTGKVSDSKGNLRDIPVNAQSSAVTLATSDTGKVVATTSGGWVIPNSTFSNGNTITLLNNSNSAQNIDASALGTALYNGADGANIKSNTIAVGARSMATIWFDQGTVAYIQGSSLTVS